MAGQDIKRNSLQLNKNLLYRPSKEDNLKLSGIASEETRKNSHINMLSIHHSLDMENASQVGQNYYPEYIAKLINNEVEPTIDELRKIAVERTECVLSHVNLVFFQPNNDDDEIRIYSQMQTLLNFSNCPHLY